MYRVKQAVICGQHAGYYVVGPDKEIVARRTFASECHKIVDELEGRRDPHSSLILHTKEVK